MLRRLTLAILAITLSASLAGCTRTWSFTFNSEDALYRSWKVYATSQDNARLACSPSGLSMSDILTASDFAFCVDFTARIKFDLYCGSGGFVDYFTVYFMDDALFDSTALFAVELGKMGDEANDYFVLFEDTVSISPSGLYGDDYLPAALVTDGENILEVQRVGQNVKCFMNGALFAEGDLQYFASDLAVPMLEVRQQYSNPAKMMRIRSIEVEYDGYFRDVPLTAGLDAGAPGLLEGTGRHDLLQRLNSPEHAEILGR